MKILVLANQKGGVGKSAIATQFAHFLRREGRSVLVIDLDHQQNTSRSLSHCSRALRVPFTASAIFECEPPSCLPDAPFVLITGDDHLSELERQANQHNLFAGRFRAALQAWHRFDVCIVDTNPNPDIRYAAALISATHVLAPVQLNQEAIDGISALLGHPRFGIVRIRTTLNPGLTFLGILPNLVEPTPFQRGNFQALAKSYGGLMLADRTRRGGIFGVVQKRTAIAEAQAAGAFVGDMTKTSARETWRELKPVFAMVLAGLDMPAATEVSA